MDPCCSQSHCRRLVGSVLLGAQLLVLTFGAQAQFSPEGGRVRMQTATTGLGSTVLLPDAKGQALRPILVLLPFTGGSAERFFGFSEGSLSRQAQQQGGIIVIPDVSGSPEDYGTAAAWSATLERFDKGVTADVDEIVQKHRGDPNRVALAGYSMGGDLAWALLQMQPKRYLGAVIAGSRASYRAKGALQTLAQRGAKLFFFMGVSESEARLAGATAAMTAVKAAGIAYQYRQGRGDHVPAPPGMTRAAVAYVLGFTENEQAEPSEPSQAGEEEAEQDEPADEPQASSADELPQNGEEEEEEQDEEEPEESRSPSPRR